MSSEENQQIAIRRAKVEALRSAGINPYPNDFKPEAKLEWIRREFGEMTDPESLTGIQIQTAGRVMLLRNFGKLTFATLQDATDQLQIAVQRDAVGAEIYRDIFRKVEVGDILGVVGTLFRTQTNELTIRVSEFRILAKALRTLPEKWHGLEDVETRYRQRYLDLIVNPEVRNLFRTRSMIIRLLREFMESKGFLEVETPMMHPIPGGATARPFVTHHNALDVDLYLRVAPELYLKRLIVGGFERVFEINRNFRNEGLSIRHNPEFTMMEFYQAYADYRDLMDLTEELILHLVFRTCEKPWVIHQGRKIDFTPPWPRLTLDQALVTYGGADPKQVTSPDYLRQYLQNHGVTPDAAWDAGQLLLTAFETVVESKLIQPTFIMEYPISVSPLSRRCDSNPEVAERFELFVGGWEIANAFSELNDPEDQARRFQAQVAARQAGDLEAMHFDADYIRALEFGMPPTAGEGIGIDRLVMLLTNAAAIREVLLFPQLRPQVASVQASQAE
ncbi:MAG: lysine--tRNA ligase [Magnetococcus sp. DMHC-1]|nr:lysine--tRNA ligase [Magnetococcales bacterium]